MNAIKWNPAPNLLNNIKKHIHIWYFPKSPIKSDTSSMTENYKVYNKINSYFYQIQPTETILTNNRLNEISPDGQVLSWNLVG